MSQPIQNNLIDSRSPASKAGSSGVAAPASLVLSPIEVESPLPSIGFLSPESNSFGLPQRGSGFSFNSASTSNYSSTPTTAAQHLISDLVSSEDFNLREKIKKTCSILSDYLQNFLNEISYNLYQFTESIHKNLPKLVENKKDINKINENTEILISDLVDASKMLDELNELDSLSKTQASSLKAVKVATLLYNRRRR